ncbi:MAG: hypothetical protein ACRDT9_07830 [Agromyces sp.]
MNHVLVPAAIAVGTIGAAWSCFGWVLDNYVDAVPASVSRWVLRSGLAVLTVAGLLWIGPFLLVFVLARPAGP